MTQFTIISVVSGGPNRGRRSLAMQGRQYPTRDAAASAAADLARKWGARFRFEIARVGEEETTR